MRRVVLSLAALAASAAVASPAFANEARVEARGGVYWSPGTTQATAGVAAGYDFDLSDTLFVGVEGSADKILDSGAKVSFGASGRVGTKLGESTKLYAIGGYTTKNCDLCQDAWNLGAGAEQKISGPVYLKAEYRHQFANNGAADSNTVLGGIGVSF